MEKNLKVWVCLFFVLATITFSFKLYAQYENEIQDQIDDMMRRYPAGTNEVYYHDMGIIARKSDLAELHELTTTIVRTHLLEKMNEYIQTKTTEINQTYFSDSFRATSDLRELIRFRDYFQPTEEFRQTAEGRAITSELGQLRQRALKSFETMDSQESMMLGLEAVRKTGLFSANSPDESTMMRQLVEEMECAISWKSKINYVYEHDFETDYDTGTIVEEGRLNLETSGKDLNAAKWGGEWIYHIKGREGTSEAVSQATLTYQRGKDIAELLITYAKISSTGRMNLPIPLAGDRRTLEVKGSPIRPQAIFTGNIPIELAGCHENQLSES